MPRYMLRLESLDRFRHCAPVRPGPDPRLLGVAGEGQKKKTPSPGPQEGQQYLVPHGTIEPTQGQVPWSN